VTSKLSERPRVKRATPPTERSARQRPQLLAPTAGSAARPSTRAQASGAPTPAPTDAPEPNAAVSAPVSIELAAGVTRCNPEVATAILMRIADGESLRRICQEPGMPARATVLRWLAADPEFQSAYSRAREHQGDALDDQMSEVIAEVRDGKLDPHAGRVVLSGLQWRAGKLAPKKYGEAAIVRHEGRVNTPLEMDPEHAARVARAVLEGMGLPLPNRE
jgi:hypothetical protein